MIGSPSTFFRPFCCGTGRIESDSSLLQEADDGDIIINVCLKPFSTPDEALQQTPSLSFFFQLVCHDIPLGICDRYYGDYGVKSIKSSCKGCTALVLSLSKTIFRLARI